MLKNKEFLLSFKTSGKQFWCLKNKSIQTALKDENCILVTYSGSFFIIPCLWSGGGGVIWKSRAWFCSDQKSFLPLTLQMVVSIQFSSKFYQKWYHENVDSSALCLLTQNSQHWSKGDSVHFHNPHCEYTAMCKDKASTHCQVIEKIFYQIMVIKEANACCYNT